MKPIVINGRMKFEDAYFKYGEHVPASVADKLLAALLIVQEAHAQGTADAFYCVQAVNDAIQLALTKTE